MCDDISAKQKSTKRKVGVAHQPTETMPDEMMCSEWMSAGGGAKHPPADYHSGRSMPK